MFFLPSSLRVTARTCVPRISPLKRVCAQKRISVLSPSLSFSASKNILRRMSCVYSQTSGEFADGRRQEPRANLVSRCPARIRSFPHIWSRPQRRSLGKRALQLCPRRELLSLRLCRRSCGPAKMSTYFYRMCDAARRAQRVSICGITGMLEMSCSCVDTFERYRFATWKNV